MQVEEVWKEAVKGWVWEALVWALGSPASLLPPASPLPHRG